MRYLRNRSSWENKRAQRNGDKNRLLLQRFVLDIRCFSGFFYQVQSTRLLGLALSGRANKSNGYGSYTELHMTRIAWLTRYFCKTAHLNRRLNLSEEYGRCSSQFFFFLFSLIRIASARFGSRRVPLCSADGRLNQGFVKRNSSWPALAFNISHEEYAGCTKSSTHEKLKEK